MKNRNAVPVTEKDLAAKQQTAQALISKVSWRRKHSSPKAQGTYLSGYSSTEEASLQQLVENLRPEDPLLDDKELLALRSVRRGLQIALHVVDEYRKRAGVADFNTALGLTDEQKTEYNRKMQTAAAITVFVLSSYVAWKLGSVGVEPDISSVELGDISLEQPIKAAKSWLFFVVQNARNAETSERLLSVLLSFAEQYQQEIQQRVGALHFAEPFTSVVFQVEGEEFTVSGFEEVAFARNAVEFRRISFDEIVGNKRAKQAAKRRVQRMLCYDFVSGKNPFVELGGFVPIMMGYGKPGTGKSMIIAATATMLAEYCEALSLPFLFNPLPENLIDSYQGNSAKNMVAWMSPMQDPKRIVYSPIDDAENIFEDRTREHVSEGVRAVIGVFLRYTEGASAIVRGNAAIDLFTNLPEQLDAAVLSRIQARFPIDGAETPDEFLAQMRLGWRGYQQTDPGFINLDFDTAVSSQKLAGQAENRFVLHESIKKLEAEVVAKHHKTSAAFFAELFAAVLREYPAFSSRDVRNIQAAVDARVMDFDLPDEWFQNPEAFVQQPYERKRDMILELRKQAMKGLSFAEIFYEETMRYLDTFARMGNRVFERKVSDAVERLRVHDEATRRFKGN